MNLTIGVVVLALLFGTVTGPLETLSEIPDGALDDVAFWQQVGEESVRAFAQTGTALIGVVAAALGLPLLRRQQVATTPTKNPVGDGPPGGN